MPGDQVTSYQARKRRSWPRKRKAGAGRTRAEGVPDAMAQVRHKTTIGELLKDPANKCEHCGRLAYKGTRLCRWHGGIARAQAQARAQGEEGPRGIRRHDDHKQGPLPGMPRAFWRHPVVMALGATRRAQVHHQALTWGTPEFSPLARKFLGQIQEGRL